MADDSYKQAANAIAAEADRDILLLNGPIVRPHDVTVANLCATRRRRRNLLFVLVTKGGDADAAYRIARCLQQTYEHFCFFVSGYCKSAGTLVATGAHELVIADGGELGPLDVQLSKEDELGETRSGLTVLAALSTLHKQAFAAFEYFLLQTKHRGGTITTRTAIQVASELTGKLFAPIYNHVDAMHVGEAGRSLGISSKYGELLTTQGQNLKPGALDGLTADYPSHGFVIDHMQARGLFRHVRGPNSNEVTLAAQLGDAALAPIAYPREPLIAFLNDEVTVATPEFLGSDARESNDNNQRETALPHDANTANRDSGTDAAGVEPAPPERPRAIGAGVRG